VPSTLDCVANKCWPAAFMLRRHNRLVPSCANRISFGLNFALASQRVLRNMSLLRGRPCVSCMVWFATTAASFGVPFWICSMRMHAISCTTFGLNSRSRSRDHVSPGRLPSLSYMITHVVSARNDLVDKSKWTQRQIQSSHSQLKSSTRESNQAMASVSSAQPRDELSFKNDCTLHTCKQLGWLRW